MQRSRCYRGVTPRRQCMRCRSQVVQKVQKWSSAKSSSSPPADMPSVEVRYSMPPYFSASIAPTDQPQSGSTSLNVSLPSAECLQCVYRVAGLGVTVHRVILHLPGRRCRCQSCPHPPSQSSLPEGTQMPAACDTCRAVQGSTGQSSADTLPGARQDSAVRRSAACMHASPYSTRQTV